MRINLKMRITNYTSLVLFLLVLTGCSKTEDKPVDISKLLRSESILTEKSNDSIKSFWTQFKQKADQIKKKGADSSDKSFSWISEDLKKVDPDLTWLIQKDKNNPKNIFFVVRADWIKRKKAIVDALVQSSPKLDGITVSGWRQAVSISDLAQAYKKETGHDLPLFSANCEKEIGSKINVIFSSPQGGEKSTDFTQERALALCSLILGEEKLNKWFAVATTKIANPKPMTDSLKAAQQLTNEFDVLIKEYKDKLPAEPYFQMPYLTLIEVIRPAGYGLATKPFYSECYSKFGEKFCAVRMKDLEQFKFDSERLGVVADLSKRLQEAKAGCAFSCTVYPPHWIDFNLCLVSEGEAIPIIKSFCDERKFSGEIWFVSHDSDRIDEWFGISDNAGPAPKDERKY